MKQVTMESVKQRISELTYTGVQSLRGEFELACLRELVAVTEQRDALVLENALIDSDRLAWAELYGDEMGDPDVIEKAKALSKPATDAAIAALRAEGAHFIANRMLAAWEAGFIDDTAKNAADIARMILTSTEFMAEAPAGDFERSFADGVLDDIARQLRESKGANHE